MYSPFPGMDPCLEGSDWPDFRNSLAYVIKKLLVPQLTPGYAVRLEKYVALDFDPAQSLGIVYPDIEVWKKPQDPLYEPKVSYESVSDYTPPTLTLPFQEPIEIEIPVVEIRETENNKLITSIEILSPVNKRSPGFEKHVEKQQKLHDGGVNLIEIDLLRQGKRAVIHPIATNAHYLITLLRGYKAELNLWAIDIKEVLPVIPIPLKAPDKDTKLNLQEAFEIVYLESGYGTTLSYKKAPPSPAFSVDDQTWIDHLINS